MNSTERFEAESETYNLIKYYTSNIEPLVKDIRLHCYTARIPMFMTFAVRNTKTETEYFTEMNLASTHKTLENNKISKLLLRLNDFKVKPPKEVRQAIKILEAYIDSGGTKEEKENRRILTDNKIDGMYKIMEKDATISHVPDSKDKRKPGKARVVEQK